MKYFAYIFIMLAFVACNTSNQPEVVGSQELIKIRELEKAAYNEKTMTYDKSKANQLILFYEEFANFYDKDTLTPGFLFKAGELAMSLNLSSKAVMMFGKVNSYYPDYKKAATCIFLQGFIFETQMFDNVRAKEKYALFIEKYPEHELVNDAKASINNLGKSLEELVRSFEENQADSLTKE